MGDECVWLLRLGDDFQIRSMLNRGHSEAVYKRKHSLTGSATFFRRFWVCCSKLANAGVLLVILLHHSKREEFELNQLDETAVMMSYYSDNR